MQPGWNGARRCRIEISRLAENFQQGDNIFARGGLVQADGQGGCINGPQVVAVCNGIRMNPRRTPRVLSRDGLKALRRVAIADFYSNRVKKRPGNAQALRQQRRQPMDARGYRGEALGPVPDGIHASHVGEQHLRGADVGIRLLAADVLLAGLQRHAVGGLAARIFRDADDAPRHGAHIGFARGEKRRMRAAITHRHAEALR